MDTRELKIYLSQRPEEIIRLLESCNFYHVHKKQDSVWCGWTHNGKGSSIKVSIQTLHYFDFSDYSKGDIITLISTQLGSGFNATIAKISQVLGFNITRAEYTQIERPFGGYYKKIATSRVDESMELKTYPESILDDFKAGASAMFLRDGIDVETQEYFGVGYDVQEQRITVPWYDTNGNLIGIMGRYNHDDVPDGINKWYPIIPCRKSRTIYGLSHNYDGIISKKAIVIGESEKFPQQMRSMGFKFGAAMGGSVITDYQAEFLKSMYLEQIILMHDEGVSEEIIVEQAKKLKSNSAYVKTKVGYIYDKENKFMPKGQKHAPTDLGKKTFLRIHGNCLHWI